MIISHFAEKVNEYLTFFGIKAFFCKMIQNGRRLLVQITRTPVQHLKYQKAKIEELYN